MHRAWGRIPCQMAALVAFLALLALPSAALAEGTTYPLIPYWDNGKADQWYAFGARSPAKDGQVQAAPVWVVTTNPDPNAEPYPMAGQDMIFDTAPGEPGYSDLWQVILVKAPAGYKPNSLTSRQDVERAGLPQLQTERYLDCPIATPEDRLGPSNTSPHQGWLRGQRVSYFDLGLVSPRVGRAWRFAHGVTEQGQPAFVPGQRTVSDGSRLAFFESLVVEVPDGYQANSITTAAQVQSSGYPVRPLGVVVNLPLPLEDEAVNPAGRYVVVAVFAAAWLVAAAYLLRLPRPFSRLQTALERNLADIGSNGQ